MKPRNRGGEEGREGRGRGTLHPNKPKKPLGARKSEGGREGGREEGLRRTLTLIFSSFLSLRNRSQKPVSLLSFFKRSRGEERSEEGKEEGREGRREGRREGGQRRTLTLVFSSFLSLSKRSQKPVSLSSFFKRIWMLLGRTFQTEPSFLTLRRNSR